MGAMVKADPDRYPILNMIGSDPVWKLYNNYYNGDPEAFYAVYGARIRRRANNGIIYNGYILKELGLKVPETYTDFVAAPRKARRDKGIAGFGWTAYKGTNWGAISALFFEPPGTRMAGLAQDDKGNWYDATINPENQQVWKQVQGYWKEGLFFPNFLTAELYDFLDDLIAGKLLAGDVKSPNVGQYNMAWGLFKEKYPNAVMETDMPEGEYPLRGSKGTGPDPLATVTFQNVWQTIIPYSCKYPGRALDVIEYMLSDEGQSLHFWGVKGIHYTKDDVYNKDPNR